MRGTWFALLLVACGGGTPNDTPIVDLPDDEQARVCQNFVDDVCTHDDDPLIAGFCNDPCVPAACAMAVADGHVAGECAVAPDDGPVTVQMVEDCGATADLSVCLQGGGCMFDALEAACDEP